MKLTKEQRERKLSETLEGYVECGNLTPLTFLSATIKRYEERLQADRPEQKLALQAEEMINDTI